MSYKKLASLSSALALVYSISLPAHADIIKNFKADGSIEVQSLSVDNETNVGNQNGANNDDYRGETRTRILAGGSFDLLDDVHSRILLRKNNSLYGQTAENVNGVETALSVDNAYVKIDKVFGHVDFTMGRQFYGDSNDLLIYYGVQPDDLMSVTSLDIFRADSDIMGWARFQGIAGKLAEVTNGGVPYATNPGVPSDVNGDTDIWGGEFSTDKIIPKGNIGVGYYTEQFKGIGPIANNTLNSFTGKLTGDVPVLIGLGYDAQYVQNFGRNNANNAAGDPAHDGNAYILGLHYGHEFASPKGEMPLHLKAEYGRGSSDYVSIAAGKRFGLIWGDETSVGPSTLNGVGGAGLTNLKVVDAGIGTRCPLTHIGIDFNWYRFMYDSGTTATAGKTSAGTELDLILSYKHSENVTFEVNAATFQVGDALQNTATGTSPITRLGSDVKITF